MANKHFQFLRSLNPEANLAAAKSALSGLTLMAGEPAIALYKDEKQTVKALFAIAPQAGTGKTLFLGEDEVKALIATAKGEAIADADGKIGTLTDLKTTAKDTLVAAINEVYDAIASAETAGKVTMVSGKGTEDNALKSYTFYQGGKTEANKIGTINIPKDLVVNSGEVVTDPQGQSAGTYIKLTIANQTNPIYINVKDLVDVYTAKENAAQVQIAISDTNVVSATIVANSVTNTELSDAVNASLALANSAIQSVTEGTTNGTISVDGADVAVHGLGSAAYTNSDAYDAAGTASNAINALNAEKSGASNGVTVKVVEAAGKITGVEVSAPDFAALYDAKGAAENVKTELTGTDKDAATELTLHGLSKKIEGVSSSAIEHVQVNSADLTVENNTVNVTVTEGATNGTVSVNGVDVAVKGLGSAAYTNSNAYDASGSAATVKSEVIGTSGDAKTADTIYGAKAYADAAVADKNVSATGDIYVQATAENNKVTVAATEKLTGAVAKAESALQSVVGTAQQITVTDKADGSQTISFADDAVFDCGTF